jgi:hypothetical protein
MGTIGAARYFLRDCAPLRILPARPEEHGATPRSIDSENASLARSIDSVQDDRRCEPPILAGLKIRIVTVFAVRC